MATTSLLEIVYSDSRPGVTYEIRRGRDGNVYCICPEWRYQRKPVKDRSCKHLARYLDRVVARLLALPRD